MKTDWKKIFAFENQEDAGNEWSTACEDLFVTSLSLLATCLIAHAITLQELKDRCGTTEWFFDKSWALPDIE